MTNFSSGFGNAALSANYAAVVGGSDVNTLGKASTCGAPSSCGNGFGSAFSTAGVKSTVCDVQGKIGNLVNSSNQNIDAQIQEITKTLDGMMQSMSEQAGSKGACSAAGQMTTLTQDLTSLSAGSKGQPLSMNGELKDVLSQISQLLTQLQNTMHTNFKQHAAYQSRA